MIWFITAISTKFDSIGVPVKHLESKRTFGYYNDYIDARAAVEGNVGSMQECLYDYIVIEGMDEGVHPVCDHETWFVWENNNWKLLPNKPEEFVGIINFAIG